MRSLIIRICTLSLLTACLSNAYILYERYPLLLLLAVPLLLGILLCAGFFERRIFSKRLRVVYHGACLLLILLISAALSIGVQLLLLLFVFEKSWLTLLWSALCCFGMESVIFWCGILCVYLTSAQMGVRRRLIGILVGLVPIVNVVMLCRIITVSLDEVRVETQKHLLNAAREKERICATRYPILLVHGVFFRDSRLFNYWGRIPAELKKNGARIFYGEHDSARPVAESAAELADRIEWILKKTGAEKLNVIAHSKGGLDMRYALAHLGVAPRVASLTTVNTPHNGCVFANELLKKVPKRVADFVANAYDDIAERAGDESPCFMAAVQDLTDEACAARNGEMPLPEGVFCQSVGSRLKKGAAARFPLNLSYHIVKKYDGPNDGLVATTSFAWGERFTLLEPSGRRGISHGDMVDMNRENFRGFDVREFYVQLVSDLRERGF
jgi:triacylglycerol lipase